jgi:predicted nucleic-acid-binding protein
MIGLDTNVLVRLLVADDPVQTRRAARFVAEHCTPEAPGFINIVVLVELVWVLVSAYAYRPVQIVDALERLIAGADRVAEHHDEVRASLADYRAGLGDFVDILIGHVNRAQGCEATATFDRKATRLGTFRSVG